MTNKLIQLLKIKTNTTVRMRLSVQSSASAFAIRVTSSDCSAIALAQSIRSLFDPPSPLNDWKKFKTAKNEVVAFNQTKLPVCRLEYNKKLNIVWAVFPI